MSEVMSVSAIEQMLEDEKDARDARTSLELWNKTFPLTPGAAVMHVRKLAGDCRFRRSDVPHKRPMEWFVRYCITPPVYPVWERKSRDGWKQMSMKHAVVRARQCIICGHVHVTSQDCPVREHYESSGRTSIPRRHDGYTLQQARNFGAFDDADNWETARR